MPGRTQKDALAVAKALSNAVGGSQDMIVQCRGISMFLAAFAMALTHAKKRSKTDQDITDSFIEAVTATYRAEVAFLQSRKDAVTAAAKKGRKKNERTQAGE